MISSSIGFNDGWPGQRWLDWHCAILHQEGPHSPPSHHDPWPGWHWTAGGVRLPPETLEPAWYLVEAAIIHAITPDGAELAPKLPQTPLNAVSSASTLSSSAQVMGKHLAHGSMRPHLPSFPSPLQTPN